MFKKCLVVYLLLVGIRPSHESKCDRTPEGYGAGKSPADARFVLRIAGNPEKYTPGEQYISKWNGKCILIYLHEQIRNFKHFDAELGFRM